MNAVVTFTGNDQHIILLIPEKYRTSEQKYDLTRILLENNAECLLLVNGDRNVLNQVFYPGEEVRLETLDSPTLVGMDDQIDPQYAQRVSQIQELYNATRKDLAIYRTSKLGESQVAYWEGFYKGIEEALVKLGGAIKEEKCNHTKVFDSKSYSSYPPQTRWICSKCGEQGIDRQEMPPSYNDVLNRFKRG